MHLSMNFAALLVAWLLLAPPLLADSTPSPEARALIEELGLKASSTPISEHPDWNPQKVVVMITPKPGTSSASVAEAMQEAAGDVELIFPGSSGQKLNRELLAGVDAIIGYCVPSILKQADTSLRWVHSISVGMDHCTGLSETQLQEVVFTNNQRLSGPAIAEHTLAMLLALTRNLDAYSQVQSEAKWRRDLSRAVTFGELKGKTILVAGLGGIGTEIAWRAHGLGMRVIATRGSARAGPDYVDYVGLPDELLTLAGEADVVVNALPLTPATTGIFNKAFFEAIKPGAIFLSVGRGKSTVTADLIDALESGKLFGAGLDVTDPEPLPSSSPLWEMPDVIITPHVSSAGPDSPRRTMIIAVENLRRYIAGEPMLSVVNMARGY